ncbi:hypothetical protein CDV36_004293 [Fusarium kuroshium]|uniref:Uncharacterized protein n=1 Tax=Fusarium kuroshium TaxID=2010991 RepID=A0A3M2SEL7_9HYPO|nr:hypothetical protein CDV36_004293 [Fusarium kuroshium]
MADRGLIYQWYHPLDPWNPCVILGVSLNPTLSEIEDAFAFTASDQNLVVDKDTQTPEEFERAYERRKKKDAYVFLKYVVRSAASITPETGPSTNEKDDHTSNQLSSKLLHKVTTQVTSPSTCIPPDFTAPSRVSMNSIVTTAAADASDTTRNSSTQTCNYQSAPETSGRKSRFHIGKRRRRGKPPRVAQSSTGSSSSIGSQFSDASTDGAQETLAAISDMIQEHEKTLAGFNSVSKSEQLAQRLFPCLRPSHSSSGTLEENVSQPLADLLFKFQQVESFLHRSDADPYGLHHELVILYDNLNMDLKKEIKQCQPEGVECINPSLSR